MEVKDALLKRRSVRKFTEEAVSEGDLKALLEAAMSGPSACNTRPWEFYVISDAGKIEALHSASKFSKIKAPLAIVAAGNRLRMLPLEMNEFWVQDLSAATENILLRATDLGLGAVWCGMYPNKSAAKKVREILGAKDHIVPLNIIYLGHPAETPEPRTQYDDKYVHYLR